MKQQQSVQQYIKTLFQNKSIKQLITINNQITQEIKVHDHQIQNLVFQNYSKFISSIDTVKKMKNDLCKIDYKLKKIQKNMQEIDQIQQLISQRLGPKRQEIKKLDIINKDLNKLKNLCDFPNILKNQLNEFKNYQQSNQKIPFSIIFNKTIQAYKQCFEMLFQFRNQPLVAPIYNESIGKLQQIRTILYNLQNFSKKNHRFILQSFQHKEITMKLMFLMQDKNMILRSYLKSSRQKMMDNIFKETDFQKFNLTNFTTIQDIVNSFLLYLERIESDCKINKYFNQNYWNQYQQQITFLQNVKKNFTTNKTHTLSSDQKKHKTINQLVDQNINNVVSNLTKNIMEYLNIYSLPLINLILNKMYQDNYNISWMKLQQSLKNFRSPYEKKVIQFIIQLKNKCLSNLKSQERMKIYDLLNQMKKFIMQLFMQITIQFIVLYLYSSDYIKSKSYFITNMFSQLNQFFTFLVNIITNKSDCYKQNYFDNLNRYKSTSNKKQNQLLIKQLKKTEQSNFYFTVIHNFLINFQKYYFKKLYDSFIELNLSLIQKQNKKDSSIYQFFINTKQYFQNNQFVRFQKNIKKLINKNLNNLISENLIKFKKIYYKIMQSQCINLILEQFQELFYALGIIFPDNKKIIENKLNFLQNGSIKLETKMYTIETQIMISKKTPIFQKTQEINQKYIIYTLLKGISKGLIYQIRKHLKKNQISQQAKARLMNEQLFYFFQVNHYYKFGHQIIIPQQQFQLTSLYYLICRQLNEKPTKNEEFYQKYLTLRSSIKI